MKRRSILKVLTLTAALAAAGLGSTDLLAQAKTVKVGVLHSLSGTMAISETVLKDVALMAIEEINAKGGVMGAKIEPSVVDPASNWPLFAEKAAPAAHPGQGGGRLRLLDVACRASRCCRCSRSSTACSSTRCSTRARSFRRTSSTRGRRPTSRRFPRSST